MAYFILIFRLISKKKSFSKTKSNLYKIENKNENIKNGRSSNKVFIWDNLEKIPNYFNLFSILDESYFNDFCLRSKIIYL